MRIASSLLLLSVVAAAGRTAAEKTEKGFFPAPSVGVEFVQTSNPFPNGVQTSNPFPTGQTEDDIVTDPRLEGRWYRGKGDVKLIDHWDNDNYLVLKVTPHSETTSIKSKELYKNGRLEIEIKSAAVMPGVVTAVYLTNGDGRKSDEELGDQDEIDIEFRGNHPNTVQTNVFLSGQEDLKVIDLPYDTSNEVHVYAIEWDDKSVRFFFDRNPEPVRTVQLSRPLKPLALHASVWTTSKGWPGLIRWGGETNWKARPAGESDDVPVEAIFKITQFPNEYKKA